ncbi:MAG: hypothetical protein IKD85_00210, partial [Firmicutes bacterium]|nr:hypothetical protein [Bacillota bacterium]
MNSDNYRYDDGSRSEVDALIEQGKSQGNLTFKEISSRLDKVDLDKDQMDDIYDTLISNGVEISADADPDETDLKEIENDADAEFSEIKNEKPESFEENMSKGMAVDDPVRM